MRERVTTNCQRCEKPFQVSPSRAKFGRGKHCSRDCQYAAAREKPSSAISIKCEGCGVLFDRHISWLDRKGGGRFCSRPCRDRKRVGPLHPQFQDGNDPYRGHNWGAQKRAARKRDGGLCQACGAKGTDVHHKIPFRKFDNYEEANRLENLELLCRPCHRKADAEIQRLEREAK